MLTSLDPDLQKKALSDYVTMPMPLLGASRHTGTKPSEYERRSHPYISPKFANFSSLESTDIQIHVTYGSVELMHHEIAQFVEKLRLEVGPEKVNVCVAADAMHDHQLVFPELVVSRDTFRAQARWFNGTATDNTVYV